MIRTPRSISCGAICMQVPCGVAKNTASHFDRRSMSGDSNTASVWPRSCGKTWSARLPDSAREVSTSTCAPLCSASRRKSSTPV
jgi:hypothetical protein